MVSWIRRVTAGLLLLGSVAGAAEPAAAATKAAKTVPPAPRPALRVCLVSGANDSQPYATDTTLAELAEYLRREDKMVCEVVVMNPGGTGFVNLERLLEADAAVFFVRRKTPDAAQLALLRQFFASGKGFIALRSTSHAWENWPDFDVEILGARYGRNGTGNFGNAERLLFKPHAIWEGVTNPTKIGVALTTRRDLYRYDELAPDLDVILEGETKNGRMPVAWTRTREGGGRLFHVALGYAEEVAMPGYRRMVRNALYWVTKTPVPVEKPAAKKTED
ncbi:MAG: ThuA domain-containing protein [Opitutaceae bacterium]|nr:ThuA domain-containing protein [Opitutaceae bacterium]